MAMRSAMVGTRAPSFSLLCTEGGRSGPRQISLDDYLDRWLMLVFYSRDFSLV
jgi:alkyl hydroperoxide reductase subunit AhpC